MKKSVIAVFLLSLLATSAFAQMPIIGIFADMEATICEVEMTIPYTYATIHFLAQIPGIAGITAAEFGATGVNIPGNLTTITWNTTLVIGNIMTDEGVALAFTTPVPGPVAWLGSIEYFLIAPPGADHMMCVVPSGAGVLAVVDDSFVTIDATGWCFLANCTGGCTCFEIPTEETNWGALKSLY